MKYDPIKNSITAIVRTRVILRRLLYTLLGLLFLREWHVKRQLRRILGSGNVATMYDAGSGLGQYSYYCARRFPSLSLLAVDVKEDQIAECTEFFRKRGIRNVRFATEDLLTQSHAEEFDFILSVDVMEHIADDVTVFRNFFRSLKPNGLVLINTPSTLGGSDAHEPDDESFIEEHARVGYDPAELRQKLESAGFRIETMLFTYGPWGSRAWKAGIKIPLLMVNSSRFFFLLLPFYYLLVLPFTLFFMYLDYRSENSTGTGLLVTARKG